MHVKQECQSNANGFVFGDVDTSLTFYLSTWNVPSSITLETENNEVYMPPRNCKVSLISASNDTYYNNNLASECGSFSATIVDDEDPPAGKGFLLSRNDLTLQESTDPRKSYNISLSKKPTEQVFVEIKSPEKLAGDVSTITRTPASLTFTTTNFDVPQTIVVDVEDDNIAQADESIYTIEHSVTSDDEDYGKMGVPSVKIGILNDDKADLSIIKDMGAGKEVVHLKFLSVTVLEDNMNSYDLVLQSKPSANVVVSLNTSGK